ncbi:MAG: serine/threonine protein kinase, partial [Deltaproteobacteria bacterium]
MGTTSVSVGHVFGGAYEIVSLLASGSMGRVYLARQRSVGREVVVKTLKRSETDPELNELLARRFEREAMATARLDHPNTVRLIDFGHDDGLQYLVLERLRGRSLAQVLTDEGPLPSTEVARIGVRICRSLAEAHGAGVIHRDLKPDNVFLCDYPGEPRVVKVMDFGVARLLPHTDQHVTRITAAGLTVGTPMYIAPEQARGLNTTAATDLYALGVTLFELLTGRAPFTGGSSMEIAIKHIKEPPPRLPGDRLPPEQVTQWQDLIASLLAKSPGDRPRNAAEVAALLAPLERLPEPPRRVAPAA